MEYKDINIIGNPEKRLALSKYTDQYDRYLIELIEVNKEYSDIIKQGAGYIILQDEWRCLGSIIIRVPENDSKIEIILHLTEKYYNNSQKEISNTIKDILESIGVCYYDKEKIELNLITNDGDKLTYNYSNSRNNLLIPMLVEEMNNTEKSLTEQGLSWSENIDNYILIDLLGNTHIDQELNENNSLPKLFSKSKKILWKDIDSTKSHRDIIFSRDGHIELSKRKRKGHYFSSDNGTRYTFSYNILRDDFKLKSEVEKNDTSKFLNISENNGWYTMIETNQVSLIHSKDGKRKRIRFNSPKENNTSITVELYMNEQNEIKRCNIDFRVHKNNGKIKGVYALRIAPQKKYNKFTINYITRNGMIKYDDFLEDLLENEEKLYSTLISGNLTAELIDELITKIIPIFNAWAERNERQKISTANQVSISSMMDIEQNAVDFLKQISGEIPLPHLQAILKNFITTNDKRKKDTKKMALK